MRNISYRFPPEAIDQAIWFYLRFTLSIRDVEALLAERGLAVSRETMGRWVNHFGPMIAAHLRKRRPRRTRLRALRRGELARHSPSGQTSNWLNAARESR
jgi:transposase-like protein